MKYGKVYENTVVTVITTNEDNSSYLGSVYKDDNGNAIPAEQVILKEGLKPIIEAEHANKYPISYYTFKEKADKIEVTDTLTAAAAEATEAARLSTIRARRERECFKLVNRGQLWYNKLSSEQLIEFDAWYTAWLAAPQTNIIPEKPEWLEALI